MYAGGVLKINKKTKDIKTVFVHFCTLPPIKAKPPKFDISSTSKFSMILILLNDFMKEGVP